MLTVSTMFLLTTLAFLEMAYRAPLLIESPDEEVAEPDLSKSRD